MKKAKLSVLMICMLLFVSGCSFTRNGSDKKRKESETTEAPLVTASGTSAYYDINNDVKEAATYTDAESEADAESSEEPIVEKVSEYSDMQDFFTNGLTEYSGDASIIVNNDIPFFTDDQLTTECYIDYGVLDELGRTQASIAVLHKDNLPEEERTDIDDDIKPTGWVQNKYPGIVDSEDGWLLQRCHLIMNRMIGSESDVITNLLAGTYYFNNTSMYMNEIEALDYIKYNEDGYHLLYRVTPYYIGDELMARGVLIEGKSVEDNGESFSMCRWAYNVQPGIEIDYATGDNWSLE